MHKYPKILFVLVLASTFLIASGSALDIWGGPDNMIVSPGATADGGLIIGTDDNELNYDLFSYSLVPAGSTGFAYSDWYIPSTQTATASYTVSGASHDFTVSYQGHVQTGVKKDSKPTVMAASRDGDSYSEAHVTAIAGVNPTAVGDVYGSGDIRSSLQLSGESEGYAIANGFAGYSSESKIFCTRVDGAAVGITNLTNLNDLGAYFNVEDDGGLRIWQDSPNDSLNGQDGVYYEDASANSYWYTQTSGSAAIHSEAGMSTPSRSEISASCSIVYQGIGPNPALGNADGSTSLDMSAAGLANARFQDTIHPPRYPGRLTDISDASLVGGVSTYKFGDSVDAQAYIETDAFYHAQTDIYTDAYAYRERTNTFKKASAESYINGVTYEAVGGAARIWKNHASGIIGNEYLPGIASGAHLATALPYKVSSYANLYQDAAYGIGTQANYYSYTTGPGYTSNINDDAGSYFGTLGYTTTSNGLPYTYSTIVASYYDVNWVNGKQISMPRYDSGISFIDSPASSAIYDERSLGIYNYDDSRSNDIGKELKQTMGT